MSEAATRIIQLERRVMWRRRLLSLQTGLALAVSIGGLIAAALVLLIRVRAITAPLWLLIVFPLTLLFAAVLIHWFLTRTSERDAAFLIDQSLGLEDRVASSRMILARGGPKRAIEEAVIEDAAERIGNHHAASVVPFRLRRWYALPLVSALAVAAALIVPPRSLPVTETMAAERADIESAGEHLEQTATEVEELLPPETETASLAKEQGELGRAFRRSAATRADALKKLSALEERIRQRHDDLASTHADEIVSVAERQLGGALSTLSTTRRKSPAPEGNQNTARDELWSRANERGSNKGRSKEAPSASHKPSDLTQDKVANLAPTTSQRRTPAAEDRPNVGDTKGRAKERPEPQKRPQEPLVGKDKRDSGKADSARGDSAKTESGPASEPGRQEKSGDQKENDVKAEGEKTGAQKADEKNAGNQPANESKLPLDALKAVPNSVAEQAAKALPKVSEELLKKAGQLRANELTPADIEKLRQAAETLSKELKEIAESKELRKALEEMAKQVRPEQIEQVARQLEGQEKLKEEMAAAGRLLMENQQAKEMIAGLAGQVARVRDQMRAQRIERADGEGSREGTGRDEEARLQASRGGRANGGTRLDQSEKAADRRNLNGLGKASSLEGTHQKGSPGQYLYLQSKAGAGAARAPYSQAYPQYRREVERSVQRSRVPPNLRSVVRKYFDAINPDAKK